MKHVVLLGLVGLSSLAFAGCSSPPPGDPGVQSPSQTTNCNSADKNSYGKCYPTVDIGTQARTGLSANAIPGNRITNYGFTGYTASDMNLVATTATTTVHLAQFWDPDQKGVPGIIGGVPIKLIHVVVSSVWCGPCNMETDFISGGNYTGANTGNLSFAKTLAPFGVVFVQAIDDGPTVGTPATLSDLKLWISDHQNDFTSTVDPGNQNLGAFFDAAAVPFNMDIDARTMEILSAGVGVDTQMAQTIETKYLPFVRDPSTAKQ